MEYAVIKTGGKQYRVSEGDILEIAKLNLEKDSAITFNDVLLLVSDSSVKLGKPTLPSVKVKAKLLEQKKGEKIDVYKFKAKARYRRKIGFRALLSKVVIEKIENGDKEPASVPAKVKATLGGKAAKKVSAKK